METILVIVEGERAESQIIDNLKQVFINDKVIIKILYGTSVYHLYKKITEKDDDFDIIEILREMSPKNREVLIGIKRRHITSIFLFFDQDSHNSNASEKALEELIDFFDNDMEKGKLYISYPMVEALRDMDNLEENYNEKQIFWNIENNKSYKKYASEKIKEISFLSIYKNYDSDIWKIINRYNWKKANFLINDIFSLPDYKKILSFNQRLIYNKQHKLNKNIIVLSAFPFFLAEYLKEEKIIEMLK